MLILIVILNCLFSRYDGSAKIAQLDTDTDIAAGQNIYNTSAYILVALEKFVLRQLVAKVKYHTVIKILTREGLSPKNMKVRLGGVRGKYTVLICCKGMVKEISKGDRNSWKTT